MDDQEHRNEVVAKYPGCLQMSKAVEQAILHLQPQHQRLKNDQTGKRGQVLVFKFDEFAKSQNPYEFVIPAKAGIQLFQVVLDPGFRRGDDPRDLLRVDQFRFLKRNRVQALI